MRLGRKNLVYSMALAGIMLISLVGYFIYMLPYLYVDYMMEQNLRSVRQQHDSYMRNGTYEGVQVKNSTACFSVEIPAEGNYILVTGKAFSARIIMRDERLLDIFERCRGYFPEWTKREAESSPGPDGAPGRETGSGQDGRRGERPGQGSEAEREFREDMEELGEILKNAIQEDSSLPVEIRLLYTVDMADAFFHESVKIHPYSDGTAVIEASVEDSSNQYVTYMALEPGEEAVVMSFLPVVAPQLSEIRPVVLQSLPMLGAVIMLMVLLFSGMYSRGIVTPIVELAHHTRRMKDTQGDPVEPFSGKWQGKRDEVGLLADTLDDFYLRIREGYQKLEEKNRELEERGRRQEVFLRASSHQLKTPVAAALLLVDGMINEIGRYRDTKIYLPRVKEQLLSMRTMVEDILYLSRCEENIKCGRIEAAGVLRARLHFLLAPIGEKRLSVEFAGEESLMVYTDERLFSQILDNLLSNAVKYTPEGGRIVIGIYQKQGAGEIRIENFGVRIPPGLLPHIYEPFVAGGRNGDSPGTPSHGLGLYIASYYAKKLGITLSVGNREDGDGVAAVLAFR